MRKWLLTPVFAVGMALAVSAPTPVLAEANPNASCVGQIASRANGPGREGAGGQRIADIAQGEVRDRRCPFPPAH